MAEGAGTIDSLSIEIGASSTKAVQQINKLADALKNLKTATGQIDNGAAGKLRTLADALKALAGVGNLNISASLPNNLSKLAGAMKAVKSEDISKLRQVAAALKTLDGVKSIAINNKLAQNIADIAAAADLMKAEHISKITAFGNALKAIGAGARLNDNLAGQITAIAQAVEQISDETLNKINRLTKALARLRNLNLPNIRNLGGNGGPSGSNGAGGSNGDQGAGGPGGNGGGSQGGGQSGSGSPPSNAGGLLGNMKRVAQLIMGRIQSGMKGFSDLLKRASNYAARIAKSIASFAKQKIKLMWDRSAFGGLEKSIGRIKNVINSFGRIAFYRAIRSAIKYVTDALKEGVENAYHYSKEFGDATGYIAEAYDRISSSEFKMSNQLGAAWATIIAYVEPIIVRLINLVTKAADAITQFFAIMSGKGTYLKAVDYNKEWADSATGAAKAAKEWKNQLMGFDEINRLEEPSDGAGGGGGKAGTGYGEMFEEAAKNDFFEEIRDAFENGEWARLGTLLGDKFNEIVDSVDWKGFGKKIGRKLQAEITVAYNFLKTADFKNLGVRISEFFNNAINQVNFGQAGRTWMRLRLALLDFLLGITDGLNWSMLAIKLSNFILGSLNELAEWLRDLDPAEIAAALRDFFGNIKYGEIGAALKEVFSLAVESALSVFDELGLNGETIKTIAEIVLGVTALGFALHEIITVTNAVTTAIGLLTSPVGLVILGFTALVAAGVLVYKNWDTIKETATRVFGPLFDNISLFIGGIKEEFSGLIDFVAGVFTGDWSRAWSGIAQIFGGVYDIVTARINGMFGLLRSLVDGIASAISWVRGLIDHMNVLASGGGISLFGGHLTIGAPAHAEGGFPEDGLFYANHGELVGKFSNGRTAVANNEQIVAGISAGVFDAVVAAFSQTGGNNGGSDRPVNIYLDGKVIAQSTTKYQNQFARARG